MQDVAIVRESALGAALQSMTGQFLVYRTGAGERGVANAHPSGTGTAAARRRPRAAAPPPMRSGVVAGRT